MNTWWTISTALVATMAVAACGDDSGGDDGDGTGGETGTSTETATGTATGTNTGTSTSTGTSTGTGTSTSTGTNTGTGECSDEPTAMACQTCCANENQAAVMELNGLLTDQCLCGAGAVCEAECTADCPTPGAMLSASCTACGQAGAGAQCAQAVLTECGMSATCAPIVACLGSC